MAGRDRDECPFFQKTGACRFAERCSRSHTMPESSRVLMFPGMFTNFRLQQSLVEDNDVDDLELEYDDNELYQNFEDFYNDVLPEFRSVGRVTQFKVSCNCEPHLRGNVYVQYKKEECAQKAFAKFNGRWYGGRQLSCAFVTINKWKSAICGLAFVKRCPKGKTCNFLHVFRNPCNEFWQADKDIYPDERNRDHRRDSRDYNSDRRHGSERRDRYSEYHDRDRSRYSSRRYDRSRSRSRSPRFRRRRRRSYSKSPDSRSQSRKRSRSPDESRRKRSRSRSPEAKSRIRSRSRSPMFRSRNRLRSRSKSRKSRSRSRSKSKSRMLSRSRSRSKSKRMSRSRSRSRSKVRNEVEHSNGRVVETPSVKSFRSDGSESDSGKIEHLHDKQKLKKHKKQKKKSKKHKHKHRSKKSETNSKFESSDTSNNEEDQLDKPNIIEIPPDNDNDDFGDVVFEDVYV